MARIGEVIANKYEILAEINKGGFAIVYLAKDCNLNKTWAVKELRVDPNDPKSRKKFESAIHEANIMKKLEHPDIPRITDIVTKQNVSYVVMDFIEGENLKEVVEKYGAQDQEKVIEWGIALAKILQYLHSLNPPMIYRDMKPGNIILKPDGSIKLLDFGITREYKEDQSRDTMISGTTSYAPPEQFAKGIQTDHRADIFSLGATMFNLLTGHGYQEIMNDDPSIRYFKPELHRGLDQIIKICLKTNPDERFQNVSELIYALENLESYDPVNVKNYKKKRKIFISTMITAIVCLVLSLGSFIAAKSIDSNTYDSLIGEVRSDLNLNPDEDKKNEMVDTLFQAIDVDSSNITAYDLLIDLYQNDLVFDHDEEGKFDQIKDKIKSLEKNKEYAELCYKIGSLYLYYYSEDLLAPHVDKSQGWFAEAVETWDDLDDTSSENYDKANLYNSVFKINKDNSNPEGVDRTKVRNSYRQLVDSVHSIKNSNDYPPIVVERTLQLCLDYIEKHAPALRQAGITYDEVDEFMSIIRDKLDKLQPDPSRPETEVLKQKLTNMIDGSIKSQLKAIYSDNEG